MAAVFGLAYLLAFTPAGLALTTLLTLLDGGHQCAWQETSEGRRLVLHHGDLDVPTSPAAAAACGRSQAAFYAAGSAQPDHVFDVNGSAWVLAPNLSLFKAKAEGGSTSALSAAYVSVGPAGGPTFERPPAANRRTPFGARADGRPVPVAFTVLLL